MAEKSQLDIELILTRYFRDMANADKLARRFDNTLRGLIQTTKSADLRMKVEIDTDAISKAEQEIKSLDASAPDVSVNVTADTTKAQTDLRSIDDVLPSGLSIDVTADTEKAKTDLRSIDDVLPSGLSIDVRADTAAARGDIQNIEDDLEDIRKLAVINLAITGVDAIRNTLNSLPLIGAYSDTETALRNFEAQTGQTFEGLGEIIDRVFVNNLGASREEVAAVAAEFARLKTPIGEIEAATIAAFNTGAATGEDLNAVIRTMDQLVVNGLVPNYSAASDLIVGGFQRGGNRAGDLLDTLTEYAPNFKAAGISGDKAMDLIVQGLQAGTFNADKMGDVFKEMNIIITDALGGENIGARDALKRLGIFDEAEAYAAGTITGNEFAAAAVTAIEEKGSEADFVTIFGTPVEDLGIDIFKNLDFSNLISADNIIPEGTAQEAADTLYGTIDNAIAELQRTVETELLNSFKISGQTLVEFLNQAKQDVQEVADLLQGGATLPEAIEVAFEVPGFSQKVDELISSIGNMVIEIESFIASVLGFFGQGEAAAGLQADVTARAGSQLEFDLKIADSEEEIAAVVQRALDRGVDQSRISSGLETVIGELIDEGDIAAAQTLLDTLNVDKVFADITIGAEREIIELTSSNKLGIDIEGTVDDIKAQAQAFLDQQAGVFDSTIEITKIEVDTSSAQDLIDTELGKIEQKINDDIGLMDFSSVDLAAPIDSVADLQAAYGTATDEAATSVENMVARTGGSFATTTTDLTTLQTNSGTALGSMQGYFDQTASAGEQMASDLIPPLGQTEEGIAATGAEASILGDVGAQGLLTFALQGGSALDYIAGRAILAAAAIRDANSAAAATPTSGSGGGPPPLWEPYSRASGGVIPAGAASWVGEQGPELIFPGTAASVLNNRSSGDFIHALSEVLAGNRGGGSASTYNTTINMNTVFNTRNEAQSRGAAEKISAELRGYW
jgi:hypothetical protein